MCEAKAAPGRVDDLLRWARGVAAGRDAEVYRGAAQPDLVVILLREPAAGAAGDGEPPASLAVPADLIAGNAGCWPFERVDGDLRQ